MTINGQHIVGRQIPETYFSLIPVLEKEQQAFRSKSKSGVMEKSNIWMLFDKTLAPDLADKKELPDMVDFLKEAGFLLHYEDPNDHLDQYYFVRPNWLYSTLLRVVRHALEHHSQLFLTHSEICSLVDVSWSKDIAQALIRLMIRYSIVLPTHRDQYLITCLLPCSQPLPNVLYCGTLRRQFASEVHSIPIDMWPRLLCSIISNLSRIVDVSKLNKESKSNSKANIDDEMDKLGLATMTAKKQPPECLDRDSASATTVKRAWKEIGEDSPISPTAKLLNASRILQKASPGPVKRSHWERSFPDIPASPDSFQTKSSSKNMDANIDDEMDKHTTTIKKEPPECLDQDSASATTERRTSKNLQMSPTARLASRIRQKTSPMIKRFHQIRSGIPASPNSFQTLPTSDTPVNGRPEVSPQYSAEGSKSRHVYTKPVTIDEGVEIWDSGMIYNHKDIKFSIFPCVSEVSTVEEKGIEICCTRNTFGYAVMARLCCLVQRTLEERFPYLFSTETHLRKHELTQIAICPTCLEKNQKNPSYYLIEACVRTLWLKREYNCRCSPKAQLPLQDLVPDYLLLDFPSHFHLTNKMLEYNKAKPLHRDRQTILYNGLFAGKEVAIKIYQVDNRSRSIALSLSCVKREVDMLSSLNHPNIIKTFGFCLDPACVLVEKAPLGNLYQKLMDSEVKISRTVQFHISCQITSALSYLHQRDIIYRTLKASSILLWSLDFNCEASIKLTHFERAAYQSPSGLMSETTFSSHPAPEMLRYAFREEYTQKVDIYAFGILLSELMIRMQPYKEAHSNQLKLSAGIVTISYRTIVKLMEECWQEDPIVRPSATDLLVKLSQSSFQCYIASQVIRDCVTVRGCCFVPSVQQIWIYGEYNKMSLYGDWEISQETQVFILNAETLTVQGLLELNERATTICTVDNKIWIGMAEPIVHVYSTTTFKFTGQFHLDDSATIIADNNFYVFIGQANGQLKCYPKMELQRGDCQPVVIQIGDEAIITIVADGDIIWLGCGNELMILRAVGEVEIECRAQVCELSDQVCAMAISHNTSTAWCLTRNSHHITGWNRHTTEKKHIVDLSKHLKVIGCELNYDPNLLAMVSIECVCDTLWVGLSCGVIMILSDLEEPEKIIHFKAHKQSVECLLKIPHSSHHEYPVMLSGGYGEVSPLSSAASEQNGVVMLWHAFTANEFSTISRRHKNYIN